MDRPKVDRERSPVASSTKMKPSPRYLIAIEPVRLASPRAGTSTEKQTFDFFIKPDRVYHDVRFHPNRGHQFSPDADPRLRKIWLFESDKRRFASELQALFKEDRLDHFLLKSPLGNFYDLEHRMGHRVETGAVETGTLFCSERVWGGLGRIFIKRGD